jgi:two-component system response regulator PilR (NtrC family)
MKKGLVEVAERGTIFLDEIGEMNATMQVKLLRVLQDRRFRRLGRHRGSTGRHPRRGGHQPGSLEDRRRREVREDLYYRINVIEVHLPPLRDRREDIPLLAEHFLPKFAEQMGKPVTSISHEAQALLDAYDWPGNVRELQNVIERAVALEPSPVVLPESLPAHLRATRTERAAAAGGGAEAGLPVLGEGFDLEARGEAFYRHYLALALERAGGVQVKAAEMLGMSFRSFRYYAKKYKLRDGDEP